MRYVSVGEYCFKYFGLDQNQPVVKPYLLNIDHGQMNCKLFALSKYDRSQCTIEYLDNVIIDISMRYMQ